MFYRLFLICFLASEGIEQNVWYGMVWYGTVRYGMVWYGTVWYGIVLYGTVRYGMVWYCIVWYGMVCYSMEWYGMVWYGMVWHGMVWYGVSHIISDFGNAFNRRTDVVLAVRGFVLLLLFWLGGRAESDRQNCERCFWLVQVDVTELQVWYTHLNASGPEQLTFLRLPPVKVRMAWLLSLSLFLCLCLSLLLPPSLLPLSPSLPLPPPLSPSPPLSPPSQMA